MNKLKVSLILTIWNGESTLKSVIKNIKDQTYKNIEYVICDDCSSDNSIEIIKKEFRNFKNSKIILNKKNIGGWQNFLNGVKNSSGDYLCWICQDDQWSNNFVEEIVKTIENYKLINNNYPSLSACKTILMSGNKKLFTKEFTKYKFEFIGKLGTISYLLMGIKSNRFNKINVMFHGLINKKYVEEIIKIDRNLIIKLYHDRHFMTLLALKGGWCSTNNTTYFRSLGTGELLRKKRDLHTIINTNFFYSAKEKVMNSIGLKHMILYSKSLINFICLIKKQKYVGKTIKLIVISLSLLAFVQDFFYYFFRICITIPKVLLSKIVRFIC